MPSSLQQSDSNLCQNIMWTSLCGSHVRQAWDQRQHAASSSAAALSLVMWPNVPSLGWRITAPQLVYIFETRIEIHADASALHKFGPQLQHVAAAV